MIDSANELQAIGKVLAAAGDGELVELTDEQRQVLARATVPDTLDAILAHVPIPPRHDGIRLIAKAWSEELRAAFRLQSIAGKITEDESLQTIRSVVSRDDRLSTEERLVFLIALTADDKRIYTVDPDGWPRAVNLGPTEKDRYLQKVWNTILQGGRFSETESQELLSELTDLERHPGGSGSTSSQLPAGHRPCAYLSSISVEGFRGIGQRVDLPLEPQRGLTLVYGANGSGKSTFVEALDVLLTGSTARFAGRSREWRSAWVNAHSPDRGQIDAEFVVEDREVRRDTLTCDWTAASLSAATDRSDDSPVKPAQAIGHLDVAGAIDEFRPILGYGELGPLFDESEYPGAGSMTPFAQHIRARANIRGEVTDALWEFISLHAQVFHYNELKLDDELMYGPKYDGPFSNFSDILFAWRSCCIWRKPRGSGGYRRYPEKDIRKLVIGDAPMDAVLRSPSDWNWQALARQALAKSNPYDTDGIDEQWYHVARAYFLVFPGPIREDLARSSIGRVNERDLIAYLPRVRLYAEAILDEIHSARLEQFSQRASYFWQKIRRSSEVRFEGLSLEQYRQTNGGDNSEPALHVSLGLTIDGGRAIERGALSQGELHSLALSVFLPTLMRPESPFGFAVIDDPVQAMDEYAVDGLAEVLRDAAEELQVIVFTHDKRLPRALRLLDVEHTLINITRSSGSEVKCHVTRNPVLQALDDAQLAAEELLEDEDEEMWEVVGLHCRLAIEEAAIRTARRKMLRNDVSLSVIRDRLDDTVYSERLQARKLVALAIWGDAERIGEVKDYVTERFEDVPINDTIDNLNGLVHGDEARVRQISDWYTGDPQRLIDDTKLVIAWLERMEQSDD